MCDLTLMHMEFQHRTPIQDHTCTHMHTGTHTHAYSYVHAHTHAQLHAHRGCSVRFWVQGFDNVCKSSKTLELFEQFNAILKIFEDNLVNF